MLQIHFCELKLVRSDWPCEVEVMPLFDKNPARTELNEGFAPVELAFWRSVLLLGIGAVCPLSAASGFGPRVGVLSPFFA